LYVSLNAVAEIVIVALYLIGMRIVVFSIWLTVENYNKMKTVAIKTGRIERVLFFSILLFLTNGFHASAQNKSVKKENSKSVYYPILKQLNVAIVKAFYNDTIGYYNEMTTEIKNENGNRVSYLWPLCGLVQAYNEVEVVLHKKGLVEKIFTETISHYFDTRPPAQGYASYPPVFGGGDRFYDDNQWIGIALMDNWKEVGGNWQLDKAKEIYQFMMTAYDTASGGGLYWQEGKLNTKNTCSSGPGIILALQLFNATQQQSYLDSALLLYNWVNKYLKDEDGLYFDNINTQNQSLDKRKYSYNTGTMIQSGIYLYEITKDKKYLDWAIKTANASISFFYGKGKFIDDYWFNAVLLRAYQHLFLINKDAKYLKAFKTCVAYSLKNHLRNDGLIMSKGQPENLTNQAGMLEILARFVQIEQTYGPL
jgi:rhamnogalacturonyl hydrolase YesR